MLKNLLHIILKVHKKFQVDRLSPTIKKTFPLLTNLRVKLQQFLRNLTLKLVSEGSVFLIVGLYLST